MKNILAQALAVSVLISSPASAAYTITFQQVGNNVVATGSGSLKLGSGVTTNGGSYYGSINPSYPSVYVGSGGYTYTQFTNVNAPANLGAGPDTLASSNTGSFVGMFYTDVSKDGWPAKGLNILTPQGYVSGSALADSTSTYNNRTLAGLGLSAGTYVYSFGQGANVETFTVQVGSLNSAVPEPATWAMMLIGFGAIGGAMRRRQRVSVRFA